MDNFISFLRDNWRFLLQVFVPLVSLVILCLLKKTKIKIPESIISVVLLLIPDLIDEAEDRFGAGHGPEKLRFVLKRAVEIISSDTGIANKDVLDVYGDTLIQQVEKVLSTPKKKKEMD